MRADVVSLSPQGKVLKVMTDQCPVHFLSFLLSIPVSSSYRKKRVTITYFPVMKYQFKMNCVYNVSTMSVLNIKFGLGSLYFIFYSGYRKA